MSRMEYEYNLKEPEMWIRDYIEENNAQYKEYYCRGVVVGEGHDAKPMITIIEAIPIIADRKTETKKYKYKGITFFKEVMDYSILLSHLQEKSGCISGIAGQESQSWQKERLPLKNHYMNSPGYLVSTSFAEQVSMGYEMLIEPGLPYYPDTETAVKDWLELPLYHGESDGRNGKLIFLFPEVRAYFSGVEAVNDAIKIHVTGAQADKSDLEVNGAWWLNGEINHFRKQVKNGEIVLTVPQGLSRLECVLIDGVGMIYDYHYENERGHSGLGRVAQNSEIDLLRESLREDLRKGEGECVEYKKYVEPLDKKKGKRLSETKLYEVMKTICAFANTSGGMIYIGVNDDCCIEGINQPVAKWKKADADDEVIAEYMTAIRTGIRDHVIGAKDLEMDFIRVDGKAVVLIEVATDTEKTTYIKDEHVMYYRRGSNTTRLRPDEWKAVICNNEQDLFSSWPDN